MGGYLEVEYENNYTANKTEWDFHYSNVRDATFTHMLNYFEKIKPHGESVIAVLGPGTDPANRDLGHSLLHTPFAEARGVLLVDSNAYACKEAYRSVMNKHGLQEDRVQGVKVDLSQGMTIPYAHILGESVGVAQSEDELLDATLKLLEGGNFMDKVVQKLDEMVREQMTRYHAILGGDRDDVVDPLPRPLTAGKQPVNVDLFLSSMLYSGMGAAVESRLFWRNFVYLAEEADSVRRPDSRTLDVRAEIIKNMHKIITAFGTEMAFMVNKWAIDNNDDARVIGISDVSTIYDYDLDGRLEDMALSRIDPTLVASKLAEHGISFKQSVLPHMTWDWCDQKGKFAHRHPIQVFTAKKIKRGSTDSLANGSGQDSGITPREDVLVTS